MIVDLQQPRRPRAGRPRRAALAAAAVGLSLALAACKDEKTRLPFTTVQTPGAPVTGPTQVFFSVADRAGNTTAVTVAVSDDSGRTFRPATPLAGNPTNVVIAPLPAGATGFFVWDPIQDLGPGIHRDVVLNASAFGHGSGIPGQTSIFTVDLTDRVDPVTSGGDERALPVASALPDDRVWVTGGTHLGSLASGGFIYDPRTDALTSGPGLSTPREAPGWALLRGDQVLVAGGGTAGAPSDVVDTLTPVTGGPGTVSAVAGGLLTPRIAPAVAALLDGRALIIGGDGGTGSAVADFEVFDPASGTVGPGTADARLGRRGHAATTLLDGRVLVTGGVDDTGAPITQAVLIDPVTLLVSDAAVDSARAEHAAVLLPDGRVLVAGGTTELGDPAFASSLAALYDPVANLFQQIIMDFARHRPGAAYAGGAPVVFGGANSAGLVPEAERLDLDALQFVEIAGPHGTPRADAVAVATGPGRALIVGGDELPEVYSPDASLTIRAFDPLLGEDRVPGPRADHTATLLADGNVLIVGGTDGISLALDTVQRFDTLTSEFVDRASLDRARADHAAAQTSGTVLVAGGRDATGLLVAQAELYDAVNDDWTPAGTLGVPRAGATAVTLGDGSVLVSGGVDATGTAVATQERWNPATRTFSTVTPMSDARREHRAIVSNGHAVIGPGFDETGAPQATADAVVAGSFTVRTATAADARAAAGLALPAASGNVAVVSGGEDASGPRSDVAFLDLRPLPGAAPVFLATTRPLVFARAAHESVSLLSGRAVLLVGGRGPDGTLVDSGEVYEFSSTQAVETGRGRETNDPRAVKARVRHTATLLPTGRVLIVGGVDERGVVISGAEVFR